MEEEKQDQEQSTEGAEKQTESLEAVKADLARMTLEVEQRKAAQAELETKLGKSKTPEEFGEAATEYQRQIRDLENQLVQRDVVAAFNVPEKFAALVKGDTREEMEAVAKLFEPAESTPGTTNRSGGGIGGARIDPPELPDDPGKLAAMIPRGGVY